MQNTFSRVSRDRIADSLNINRIARTPVSTLQQTGAPVGSVLFDNTSNEFYGVTRSGPVALTSSVTGVINVGVTPTGMCILPRGNKMYVANNNNYGITGADSVTVVDVASQLPIGTIHSNGIDTFSQPYTITASPDGTKVYVTNSFGTTISVIDTTSDTIVAGITGLDGPSGMVIKGSTGYVNNYGAEGNSGLATTVRTVDLNSNTVFGAAITVDQAPAALAITPDLAHVYVACYVDGSPNNGTVRVINTSNNAVSPAITGFSGPFGIAITGDGSKAYVTNFGDNNFFHTGSTVSVIDTLSNTIVSTITTGMQPAGIAVSPDDKWVFVSNYNTLYGVPFPTFLNLTAGQGTVSIIDAETDTVAAPAIGVGQSPSCIVFSKTGDYAFVSCFIGNTVNVLLGR